MFVSQNNFSLLPSGRFVWLTCCYNNYVLDCFLQSLSQGLDPTRSILILSLLPSVLDFWEAMDPERIRQYNNTLAKKAASMLAERWSTGLLSHAGMFGPMVLIRLPEVLLYCVTQGGEEEAVKAHAEMVQAKLHYEFSIEVPVKLIQGKLHTRISAHVYNQLSDYTKLCNAILVMADDALNNPSAYDTYKHYR